jgi:hypothetical protein
MAEPVAPFAAFEPVAMPEPTPLLRLVA